MKMFTFQAVEIAYAHIMQGENIGNIPDTLLEAYSKGWRFHVILNEHNMVACASFPEESVEIYLAFPEWAFILVRIGYVMGEEGIK